MEAPRALVDFAAGPQGLAPLQLAASRPFQLLQTMRVQGGVACHLGLHLDRLARAAAQFGFPFACAQARRQVRRQVDAAVTGRTGEARARVTVDFRGSTHVEVSEVPHTPGGVLPVCMATHAISAPTAFLRHKTTRRDHYERFATSQPGLFDTLLWNDRGEVTEFTRGNVIMELADGSRVTPPLECGLLDGVGRALELAAGRVRERVVHVDELSQVQRMWFVNALRGLIPVNLTR
jgi:para-aminobenzoate synthetase/4-amino-4-deoxychorismate lyase